MSIQCSSEVMQETVDLVERLHSSEIPEDTQLYDGKLFCAGKTYSVTYIKYLKPVSKLPSPAHPGWSEWSEWWCIRGRVDTQPARSRSCLCPPPAGVGPEDDPCQGEGREFQDGTNHNIQCILKTNHHANCKPFVG